MLFVLIAAHLIVLAIATPFHKYPYVFLLDIGNEELEKTNSEQIRVSIPGGSLALRYPAVGVGDTITHVRVSGIDFGTDLKANIVDGGPGYKYVVLVFMGNTGVPYDAVITIQTLSNDSSIINNINNDINVNDVGSNNDNNSYEVSEDDLNDSSEDLDEDQSNESVKADSTQASSSYYNYVQKEEVNSNYNDDDGSDGNFEYQLAHQHQKEDGKGTENDYIDDNDQTYNENVGSSKKEYDLNHGTAQEETIKEESQPVNNLYYDRYKLLRPYLYDGVRVYPQQAIQYIPQDNPRVGFFADSEDNDETMNEVEIPDNNINNYRDNNNNNYDSDDNSAVAS